MKHSNHVPVRREAKTPTAIAPASIAAEPCIIAILQPKTEEAAQTPITSSRSLHLVILQGTHQGDLNLYWLYPPWVGGGDY